MTKKKEWILSVEESNSLLFLPEQLNTIIKLLKKIEKKLPKKRLLEKT